MKRGWAALGILVTLMLNAGPAQALADGDLIVTTTPAEIETTLGQTVAVDVTVTNNTDQATVPLIAHIDITDPTRTTSVDPEDWTPTLSQNIGVIPANQTIKLSWSLQPISSGTFAVYAVALSDGETEIFVSESTRVTVASSRTLNPEGVLPVVIAGPVIVGALLAGVLRKRSSMRSQVAGGKDKRDR